MRTLEGRTAGGAGYVLHVCDDPEEVARAAARRFVEIARASIAAAGRFRVALAGGSTPAKVYGLLAGPELGGAVQWEAADLFFGDERCVPPDHPESNYRMAHEAMLSELPIPPRQVHRMACEDDPAEGARRYEAELRAAFGDSEWPRFDLVMLGLGADGHTASLFPGTSALSEADAWAAANWVPGLGAWRLTLTAAAINHSQHVMFVVTGEAKADRLREVLRGAHDPSRLPAQLINPPDGEAEWFADRAAAAGL